MKFSLTLLSVAFGATLARASSVPGGRVLSCTPGRYFCDTENVFTCSTNGPALVRISTHSFLLFIVLDYIANYYATGHV